MHVLRPRFLHGGHYRIVLHGLVAGIAAHHSCLWEEVLRRVDSSQGDHFGDEHLALLLEPLRAANS